jgi:alpha-amylase
MRLVTKAQATLLLASLLLSGCSQAQPEVPETFESQVGIQLFMWNWDSIAAECPFLGETGIDWVLTSPPQEHIQGDAWWTSYQPVSYQIESKLGNREQFANMVTTCKENNVEVIADAVINHMAGIGSGTGTAGTVFSKYEYPGLYSKADFHNCNLTPNDQIQNYQDRSQVQNCELVGLSDLDQKSDHVQANIIGYLNDLISLGVAGFRIDAAKHIYAKDLGNIVSQLPVGTRIISEVIQGSGEPIKASEYLGFGEVFEFDYARSLKTFFKGEVITPAASKTRFDSFSPSSQSLSFVSNHDTERNKQTLSYATAKDFELATALMLAENYGQPILYSSYAYDSYDAGPKQLNGMVEGASCPELSSPQEEYATNQWICQQHWQSTINMIKFHKTTSGLEITDKYKTRGIYGFAKAGKGYFIANVLRNKSIDFEVETTLPDGEYENLFQDGTYTIKNGVLKATLAPKSAIALLVDN